MKAKTFLSACLLFIGSVGTASAMMQPPPMFLTAGGSEGAGAGGSGGGPCEANSWGDSTRGGTTSACSYSDGSSTWFMSEWGPGWASSVWGSATADGQVSETAYDFSGA